MATLLELAKLSRAVYDPDDDSRIPPGWEPHGASSHHEWEQTCAFHGQAYRKSSAEVVISFRGTIKKLRNFISDARLSLGFTHQGEEYAIAYAIEVLKRLRAEYGDRPLPTLTVTGHSLGGNLAQVVTAFFQNGGELPRGFNSELAKKVKADFQELAESIHMPAVTFQAPGVAKTYIAEGKDGSHYDGLHLYNPNDLVRLGGSVNIGVQAKLPMARREFKSVAPTVPDQASDTLNITSTSHSAIMESTEASPQSSAPASPWASRTPSVVSLSKLSTSAASASWSVVEGVSGAVSATAKTAVTFIPAHKIAATIEILEAQPAIGNLTPQQYKDLMARPEHLDLLRTITPAQYEVIPYHKSALLKALREDKLDASEISIVVDGLKRLMALEPEQTTLRNKGRARLIAWQESWIALKDGVGAMDSTAFEALAVLRQTLNEHRRELHELGKGLQTWVNANQDRISANEDQLLQEVSKAGVEVDNKDSLRLIADLKTENKKLSAENENLSKAIDTAYKEVVLDAELVNNKLQELGESIGLSSTSDPLQSDAESQSADAPDLRSVQARQIQIEQDSIRSELANLRKEHARSQASPSHLAEFESKSRRVTEGGPDAWMQRELRREQLSLLQKLAQADSGWSLTAVATTQALLK
ncbi:MAG TPA: Mbeg1-like protein, partial [Burkholderiales bacterium]|nr:Mbeg1-like protein [Burkholderiales bacterium]